MRKLVLLLAILLISGCQNTDGQTSEKVNVASDSTPSGDVVHGLVKLKTWKDLKSLKAIRKRAFRTN